MTKGGHDMATRRPLLARGVFSLLVAMLGGLLGGTPAAVAASSVAIRISGTVDGEREAVHVVGLARIRSTLVKTDARFNHPRRVILAFDLHYVSGTGLSTGARYVARSQDEVMRPLVASDLVEITFPLQPNTATGFTAARAGLASFRLSFDVRTGALTGGTATVSTPGS
jgi:hypothetical protein